MKRKDPPSEESPAPDHKRVLYVRLDQELMDALRRRNFSEQAPDKPHVSLTQTVTRILRDVLTG